MELVVVYNNNNHNNNNNNNNGVYSFVLTFKNYLLIKPPCTKCICCLDYFVPFV